MIQKIYNKYSPLLQTLGIKLIGLAGLGLIINNKIMAQTSPGQSLFEAHCQSCHGIHSAGIGPALNNILQKRPMPWLIKFIKSSQVLIDAGDTVAVSIFHQYLEVKMPDQELTDSQIEQVLNYIQQRSILPSDMSNNQPFELKDSVNENFMREPSSIKKYLPYIIISLGLIFGSGILLWIKHKNKWPKNQ